MAENQEVYNWRNHPKAPTTGTVLCALSAIPEDSPKFFAIDGSGRKPFVYFAVRRRGKVDVFLNRCPHKNLELGTKEKKPAYEAGKLTCVQHRAVFEITSGKCISGACVGKEMSRIDVVIRGDEVVVA